MANPEYTSVFIPRETRDKLKVMSLFRKQNMAEMIISWVDKEYQKAELPTYERLQSSE